MFIYLLISSFIFRSMFTGPSLAWWPFWLWYCFIEEDFSIFPLERMPLIQRIRPDVGFSVGLEVSVIDSFFSFFSLPPDVLLIEEFKRFRLFIGISRTNFLSLNWTSWSLIVSDNYVLITTALLIFSITKELFWVLS